MSLHSDGRIKRSSGAYQRARLRATQRTRNEVVAECALMAERARDHAYRHYGAAESVGADIAARWIRGMANPVLPPVEPKPEDVSSDYCEECLGPCLRKPPHSEGAVSLSSTHRSGEA